jgi:hypothetical protein
MYMNLFVQTWIDQKYMSPPLGQQDALQALLQQELLLHLGAVAAG